MATEIKMPQLSDTMDSGKILAWKKNEGDAVKRGDILAEVETDKANLEIECFQEGTLLKIVTPVGTNAVVGEIIAVIGKAGESTGASNGSPKAAPQPAAQAAPEPAQAPAPAAPAAAPAPVSEAAPSNSDERIKVSPLARKIAQQKNIDLSVVQGSGPQGRIIKKDIDAASPTPAPAMSIAPKASPAPSQSTPAATPPGPGGRYTPFSKMRDTIARRMVESVTQSPHFYVTTSVRMNEAMRLRELLKTKPEYQGISVNHLVIKAVAYGIAQEPRVNRSVKENQIYEPEHINVGIITAIEDGLLIPVIREANTLSLKDVVFEARAAVDRARAGRPNATDLSGGTFSISNMGMYDVENFTAIINPGQGSVLAVSSAQQQPVVEDGEVVVGSVMKATISVDHRIIDGVMASTFLKHFKEALETPALLMV